MYYRRFRRRRPMGYGRRRSFRRYGRKRTSNKTSKRGLFRRRLFRSKLRAVVKGTETKQITDEVTLAPIFSSGTATPCYDVASNLPQGDADGERIGMAVYLRSMKIRIHIQALTSIDITSDIINDGATDNTSFVRILIFWDLQPYVGTPTANDLLSQVGSTGIVVWPRNWNKRRRFRVIRDKQFRISAPMYHAIDTTNTHYFPFVDGERVHEFYIKLNKWMQWQTDASTSASNRNLYMLIVATDQSFGASGAVRVTYIDP